MKTFRVSVPPLARGGLAFAATYLFFFYATCKQWRDLRHLVQEGVRVEGTVVAKEPENHATIRFAYVVDGERHLGQDGAGRGGVPPFEEIAIGDRLLITYWPPQPAISGAGNPAEAYVSWCGLVFMLMPGISAIMGFAQLLGARQASLATRKPALTRARRLAAAMLALGAALLAATLWISLSVALGHLSGVGTSAPLWWSETWLVVASLGTVFSVVFGASWAWRRFRLASGTSA